MQPASIASWVWGLIGIRRLVADASTPRRLEKNAGFVQTPLARAPSRIARDDVEGRNPSKLRNELVLFKLPTARRFALAATDRVRQAPTLVRHDRSLQDAVTSYPLARAETTGNVCLEGGWAERYQRGKRGQHF